MTGTIRTLRVDKGFGFIKGETGQEYFFHQSAIYGEGIADLREGDGVEFEVSDGPKGPRARASSAPRRKRAELGFCTRPENLARQQGRSNAALVLYSSSA